MPILKDFRETNHLETFQKLPPTVQERIRQIEVLHDRAILYLWARAEASKNVPDFESYLRDFYKNRVKSPKKDLYDILKDLLLKLRPEPAEYFIWAADRESCIKTLGDSRYYLWPGNWSHLVRMLYELWIYWLFWPSGRRFFEEEHEIRPWYRAATEPDPPSVPSFEATLDRSLVWLAHEVGIETANIRHWGKKREARARQNLIKRDQARNKSELVFEIYSRSSRIKVGMKRYTIAQVIETDFKQLQNDGTIAKAIEAPSHYQIERYLKENPKVMHDFRQIGRFWIKQT